MRHLKGSESIRAETPQDSWRWDPLESLMHGIYSEKSESYRLAMFAWECFKLKDIYKNNSRPNAMRAVPFSCLLTKEEVIDEQLLGYTLPKPSEDCPEWLYRLMMRCWSRESLQRPSMEEITNEMYRRINRKSVPDMPKSTDLHKDDDSSEDENDNVRHRSFNQKHRSAVSHGVASQCSASMFSGQTNTSNSSEHDAPSEDSSSNVILPSNISTDGGSICDDYRVQHHSTSGEIYKKSTKGVRKRLSSFVGKLMRRKKHAEKMYAVNDTYNLDIINKSEEYNVYASLDDIVYCSQPHISSEDTSVKTVNVMRDNIANSVPDIEISKSVYQNYSLRYLETDHKLHENITTSSSAKSSSLYANMDTISNTVTCSDDLLAQGQELNDEQEVYENICPTYLNPMRFQHFHTLEETEKPTFWSDPIIESTKL